MLIGKKLESSLDPGIIYAPYIPVQSVAVISENDSINVRRKKIINDIFELGLDINGGFTPRKILNSRYSKTNISNKFYSVIEVKNPL